MGLVNKIRRRFEIYTGFSLLNVDYDLNIGLFNLTCRSLLKTTYQNTIAKYQNDRTLTEGLTHKIKQYE